MQVADSVGAIPERSKDKRSFDLGAVVSSEAFWPALIFTLGLATVFWGLFTFTYSKWIDSEGYYSHGFLVPLISGYIVYRWWPKLKQVPVRTGWLAVPFLIGILWVACAANRTDIYFLLSVSLVISLLFATWAIAGWQWMVALAAPILYLLFALPVWDQIIQNYTNPLQLASTKVAFQLLKLYGLGPMQTDSNHILLNSYQLDVGVACSGFKLLLALMAFGAFFLLIAKLKTWASLVFAASIVPIALFVNGLRISLIGVVGNAYGLDAGLSFHDYSGYITIILCFLLLDRWAKLLGWRDRNEQWVEEGGQRREGAQAKSLKVRAYAVGALFLAFGALVFAAPKPKQVAGKTEQWMEQMTPTAIGNYKLLSTYKMEPSTYQELQPYGIVSRIYGNGKQAYDVVLVASNRKTSFHDPRVCFPAQGWQFETQKKVNIVTGTRGAIPVSIISMEGQDGSQQFAAFFYRGRRGFYASPQALSWAMFLDQFAGRSDSEGVFYRFMPKDPNTTEADMSKFIADFVDAANTSSGGFF